MGRPVLERGGPGGGGMGLPDEVRSLGGGGMGRPSGPTLGGGGGDARPWGDAGAAGPRSTRAAGWDMPGSARGATRGSSRPLDVTSVRGDGGALLGAGRVVSGATGRAGGDSGAATTSAGGSEPAAAAASSGAVSGSTERAGGDSGASTTSAAGRVAGAISAAGTSTVAGDSGGAAGGSTSAAGASTGATSTGATSTGAATAGAASAGGASASGADGARRPELDTAREAAALTGCSASAGCASRIRPSRCARRRTRSACASTMLEEWLLTPIPSASHRSRVSLLVRPSSLANS
jgi:hypothetical protein